MTSPEKLTVEGALAETLRRIPRAYAPGDQVAPCAVLWLDPEQLWETIVPDLAKTMQELFVLVVQPCGCAVSRRGLSLKRRPPVPRQSFTFQR